MYCVKCGVELADTEKKCPLCATAVYHPELERPEAPPLYPTDKMPPTASRSRALNGVVIILFLIPLSVCYFADWSLDGSIQWYGFVAGALGLVYTAFALPAWFLKPEPVALTAVNFGAAAVYLLYIDCATGGGWFLGFALPMTGGLAVITCALVGLLYYLRKGRLFIVGGAQMALGGLMVLLESLLVRTFGLSYTGWSLYPLAVLILCGGLLIYLGVNSEAREIMERKLFF